MHWKWAAASAVGWPVFVRALQWLSEFGPASQGRPRWMLPAAVSSIMAAQVVTGMAVSIIERERSKETFAWLRTLPVSDWHVVLSKFVAAFVFCLALGLAWVLALWDVGPILTLPQFVSAWCVTFLMASFAILCQIAFSGRVAVMSPMLVVFLVLTAAMPILSSDQSFERMLALWRDPATHVWVWPVCAVVEALIVGATYVSFHARDTHSLVK